MEAHHRAEWARAERARIAAELRAATNGAASGTAGDARSGAGGKPAGGKGDVGGGAGREGKRGAGLAVRAVGLTEAERQLIESLRKLDIAAIR